jgi:single stranded DNA-binding protein
MYASLQIVGNVANFEVKQNGDKSFAKFSVATTSWSKEGKKTSWYNVVCWNKNLSEFLNGKVGKGSKVFVTGEPQMREYTDKNGATKTSNELVVSPFNGTVVILSEWLNGESTSQESVMDNDVPF